MKIEMEEHDRDKMEWLPPDSAMPNIIEHWRQQQRHRQMVGSAQASVAPSVSATVHVFDSANAEPQPPAAPRRADAGCGHAIW